LVVPASANETADSTIHRARSSSRYIRNATIVPRVNTSEYMSSRMKREKYAMCGESSTSSA